MKKYSILLLIGIISLNSNCARQTNSNKQNSKNTVETENKSVTYTDLLKLFKEISLNELHVWAVNEKYEGNKYIGNKIDTLFFPLFGEYMTPYKSYYRNPETQIITYSGYDLFASYKFPINSHQTALILRVPSQYEESAISIWIYNSESNRLTKSIELADRFGDENWYFMKDSWIEKRNDSICVITRQLDHEINETTNVDSIITDKFKFYKFESENFVKVDTIEIDPTNYKLHGEE